MNVTFIRRDPEMTAKEQAREIAEALGNVRHVREDGETLIVYTQWKEE